MRFKWIAAIVLVVLAAGIAAYALDTTGPTAFTSGTSTPNNHLSSQGSSVSSSSTIRSSVVRQSSVFQYLLVWGTNRPGACEGTGGFCLSNLFLGFAGQNNTTTSSVTTMIQGIWTTTVNGTTTTFTNAITIFSPINGTGYVVDIYAYVQDAATGQNATGPFGPVIGNSCVLQPTNFTLCGVDAPYGLAVSSGDPYKVTLFVTTQYLPCSLTHDSLCASQLLAPPITFIMPAEFSEPR